MTQPEAPRHRYPVDLDLLARLTRLELLVDRALGIRPEHSGVVAVALPERTYS